MTAAHSALVTLLCVTLGRLPDLRLRRDAIEPDLLGLTDFDQRTVTIARDASVPVFAATLTHELQHLRRGPCYVGDEEAEERRVDEDTARLLVPQDLLPAVLDRVNPAHLARDLGIDLDTARRAIQLALRDRSRLRGAA